MEEARFEWRAILLDVLVSAEQSIQANTVRLIGSQIVQSSDGSNGVDMPVSMVPKSGARCTLPAVV